jgi:hypothetical protein
MKLLWKLSFVLLLLGGNLQAKTWEVGPTRQYKAPSAVMSLVAAGDTVLIDSGLYVKDVGTWRANDLVLKCAKGYAHLEAQGTAASRKAIWVIDGDHTYVEGIEFSGCAISEADGSNGAGIRFESHRLECRRCYFHDNQEGILTGNDTTNEIVVEACEFDHNGVETGGNAGFQHNIYVGHSRYCRIAFCYFHRAIVGHEIKTRANHNFILYNHIVDGPTGDASYSIDMPNGGLSYVIGNSIEKGPMTENSTVIEYGGEGLINPESEFYFVNNTVVTDRTPTTFLSISKDATVARIANNIFAGPGHPLTAHDTVANVLATDTAFFHFRNPSNYDYRLKTNFSGLQSAVDLGSPHGFSLIPTKEYVHPNDSMTRPFLNEVGAFAIGKDTAYVVKSFPGLTCIGEVDTGLVLVENTTSIPTEYFAALSPMGEDFKIISLNPSKVAGPGGIDTIVLTFTPTTNTTVNATINIEGGIGNAVTVPATGGAATIEGSGRVESAFVDSIQTFSVQICNTGSCPWTPGPPTVLPPFLYVSGGKAVIARGDCDTLVFAFAPTSAGTFSLAVSFPAATGTSIPSPSVQLSGTAISAAVMPIATVDREEQNYPNPFSDKSFIPLTPNIVGKLEVFDMCGKYVDVTSSLSKDGIIIERGNLTAGIYFYHVIQASRGLVAKGSLVIQ